MILGVLTRKYAGTLLPHPPPLTHSHSSVSYSSSSSSIPPHQTHGSRNKRRGGGPTFSEMVEAFKFALHAHSTPGVSMIPPATCSPPIPAPTTPPAPLLAPSPPPGLVPSTSQASPLSLSHVLASASPATPVLPAPEVSTFRNCSLFSPPGEEEEEAVSEFEEVLSPFPSSAPAHALFLPSITFHLVHHARAGEEDRSLSGWHPPRYS